ncbi:MAG: LamG domain-containing protein [Candidatus Margulisbacteria bacterium]|nr:LamG domain-containing protein [Candidatus Margulisiibacteriota bacterium]
MSINKSTIMIKYWISQGSLFLLLALFALNLLSCGSSSGTISSRSVDMGQIIFKIPSQSSAFQAVEITLKNDDGTFTPYVAYIQEVSHSEDYYQTLPIEIPAGTYFLTKFIIYNTSNSTFYVTPLKGSEKSSLVQTPLNMQIKVEKDREVILFPEIMKVDGDYEAFGYKRFDFEGQMKQGLVTYYSFSGNAIEETGNGQDGTVLNATLTLDKDGNPARAYYFNGNTSSIKAIVDSSLSLSNLTIAAWIKVMGEGTWNPRVVAVGPPKTATQYYSLITSQNTNKTFGFLKYFNETQQTMSFSELESQTWYFIAVTYDNSNGETLLYLNGQLIQETTLKNGISNFSKAILQIGHSDNTLDRFHGNLDEIRIYNQVLSKEKVKELFSLSYTP